LPCARRARAGASQARARHKRGRGRAAAGRRGLGRGRVGHRLADGHDNEQDAAHPERSQRCAPAARLSSLRRAAGLGAARSAGPLDRTRAAHPLQLQLRSFTAGRQLERRIGLRIQGLDLPGAQQTRNGSQTALVKLSFPGSGGACAVASRPESVLGSARRSIRPGAFTYHRRGIELGLRTLRSHTGTASHPSRSGPRCRSCGLGAHLSFPSLYWGRHLEKCFRPFLPTVRKASALLQNHIQNSPLRTRPAVRGPAAAAAGRGAKR